MKYIIIVFSLLILASCDQTNDLLTPSFPNNQIIAGDMVLAKDTSTGIANGTSRIKITLSATNAFKKGYRNFRINPKKYL